MELPSEIRLLVYNELIPRNRRLYRHVCHLCDWDLYRSLHSNVPYTQILRTSKHIYSEMLPMFYSKNILHICWACENEACAPLWWFPGKQHGFLTELVEHYHHHVRNINVPIVHKPDDRVIEFSICWPQMERQILARYENVEHISVEILLLCSMKVTIDLVRRSRKPTTERVHDYKSILADCSTCIQKRIRTLRDLGHVVSIESALEKLCDTNILSNAQGHLKDTVFSVQRIRGQPISDRDKEVSLYLGFDTHSTSDTLIQEILANKDVQDENRRIEAGLMNMVAKSNAQLMLGMRLFEIEVKKKLADIDWYLL